MSARKISGEYYNKKKCSSILNENVNNSFSSPTFSRSPLYKSYSEASPARNMRYQKLMVKKSGIHQDHLRPELSIVRRKSLKVGESSSGRYSQTVHGALNRASSVHSSFPFCRPSYSDIGQLKPTSLIQSMKMNSHIMRDRNEKNSVIRALQIMESKKRDFQESDLSDCGNNSLSDDLNSVPNSKRQRMISGSSNLDGMSSTSSATQKDHIAKLSKQDTFCYTSMRDISSDCTKSSSFGLGGRQNFGKTLHSLSNGGNSKCSGDTPELSHASTSSSVQQSHRNQSALNVEEQQVNSPLTKSTMRRRISYMTPAQIESQLGNRSAAVELMRYDNKHKKNITRSAVTQTDSKNQNGPVVSAETPLSVADLIANIDKNRKTVSPLEKSVDRKPGAKDDYMEKRLSRIRTLIAKFTDSTPEPSTNTLIFQSPVQTQASIQIPIGAPSMTAVFPVSNPVLSTSISTVANNLPNISQLSQPIISSAATIVASQPSASLFSSKPTSISSAAKLLADITGSTSSTTAVPTAAPPAIMSSSSAVVVTTVASALDAKTSVPISFGGFNATKPAILSFGPPSDKAGMNKPFAPPSTSIANTSSQAALSTPSVPSVAFGLSKPNDVQQANPLQAPTKSFYFGASSTDAAAASSQSVFNFGPSVTVASVTTASSVLPPSQSIFNVSSVSQANTASLFGSISGSTQPSANFSSTDGSNNKAQSTPFSFGSKQTEQKSTFPSISTAQNASSSLFSFSKSVNQEKPAAIPSTNKESSSIFPNNNNSKNIPASTPFNFGGSGSQSTIFGATTATCASAVFATTNVNTTSSNIFGSNQPQTTSLFGSTKQPQPEENKSFFGNPTSVKSNVFGTSNAVSTVNNSLFSQASTKSSLFGANSQTSSGNLFSFNKDSNTNSTTSENSKPATLFGSSCNSNTNSIFERQTQPISAGTTNKSFVFGGTSETKAVASSVTPANPTVNPIGGFNFSGTAPASSGGFNFSNNQTAGSSGGFNFGGQQAQNVFNANPPSSAPQTLVRQRKNRGKR